jgi:hypothetical protein
MDYSLFNVNAFGFVDLGDSHVMFSRNRKPSHICIDFDGFHQLVDRLLSVTLLITISCVNVSGSRVVFITILQVKISRLAESTSSSCSFILV